MDQGRRTFGKWCTTLALAAASAGMPVLAQQAAWPAQPIRLVVAYPPGGSTDVAARYLTQQQTTTICQQIVLNNPT